MGRPLKPIDGDQVRKLAKLGLSQQDIGEFFGCVHSVISERFRQEYHEGVSESKISVRKLMWRRARAGADSILLRLDDRYFGPTERKPIVDNTEVLEALDDGDEVPGGNDQGPALGATETFA